MAFAMAYAMAYLDPLPSIAAQASVTVSMRDPAHDIDVNVLGSVRVAQAAIEGGVQRLVFVSTGGALYGEPDQVPVTEAATPAPLSVYGVSKHGVVRISEAMFFQLRDLQAQVAVSVLCPGGVRTRIASAGRNRPDALLEGVSRLTTAETDERDQMWAGLIADGGQEPEEIADKVFAAIEEERFYILTHETQDEAVRMRMEAILERRDPEIPSPAF